MADPEWSQSMALRLAPNSLDDSIKQHFDNISASGNATQQNGNIYNNNAGHSASGDARQYMGDVTNNTNYNYTIRKRRSDETLREDGRNRAFLLASAEGQTPRVHHLLRLGVDLDYSDENGFNALHHACLSGFEDVVSVLLNAGVDINAQSLDFGTPLCLAALRGRERVVELLLSSRAIVSKAGKWVGTPLHCASWIGSLTIAKMLLEHGADRTSNCVTQPRYLDSALVPGCSVSIVAPQIPDDGLYDIIECQPLHIAGGQGHENLVHHFLKIGCPVDSEFRSWKAKHPTIETFESQSNSDEKVAGKTALSQACFWGHSHIASQLIDAGAVIDKQDSHGWTALHLVALVGQVFIVRYLVEQGADVNAQDEDGETACHIAASRGHRGVVEVLVASGADLSKQDKNGNTPLLRANDAAVLERLLRAGADPSQQNNNGHTLLHFAAWAKWVGIIKLLLDYGANPMIKSKDGNTAAECTLPDATEVRSLLSEAMKKAQNDGMVEVDLRKDKSDGAIGDDRKHDRPQESRIIEECRPTRELLTQTTGKGNDRSETSSDAQISSNSSRLVAENERKVVDMLRVRTMNSYSHGHIYAMRSCETGYIRMIAQEDRWNSKDWQGWELIASSAHVTLIFHLRCLIDQDLALSRVSEDPTDQSDISGEIATQTLNVWTQFILSRPYVKRKRSLLAKLREDSCYDLQYGWEQVLKNRPAVSESETPSDHETRLRRWATLFGVPEEKWKAVE